MTAREEVLARIRGALGTSASSGPAQEQAHEGPDVARVYRSRGEMDAGELLDLLADRLVDYRCLVRRCAATDLQATITAALGDRSVRRVVLPPDLDLPLPEPADVGSGAEWVVDDGLSPDALDQFDAVITTATVAIAETGTIVLDHGPGQGRRALTLVPDFHLVIVRHDQIAPDLPDALARLDPARPQTLIAGPSATSDIELVRVEGVHGPRILHVLISGDDRR
jgi:L-lactate dehydrogenase complex protein LldG